MTCKLFEVPSPGNMKKKKNNLPNNGQQFIDLLLPPCPHSKLRNKHNKDE